MSYKKDPLINRISSNLAFVSKETELQGSIGLFNNHRHAQEFYKGLLYLIFDYPDLQELDKFHNVTNFGSIPILDYVNIYTESSLISPKTQIGIFKI